MKRNLLILFICSIFTLSAQAQEEDDNKFEKIRDRMSEFIQKRLDMNKAEAEKFAPVFLRYFREWRGTLQQYRGDKLLLRQKVTEVQIRYRTQFREIIGERRSEAVYKHQREFLEGLKTAAENRPDRPMRGKNFRRFAS